MKKNIIFILLLLILGLQTNASDTLLTGSVVYTLETAKREAFTDLDLKIDKNILKEYLIDKNNKANQEALSKGIQIDGRQIMSFQTTRGFVKGYTVIYDKEPQYVYYYTTSGYLAGFDVDNNIGNFPYKVGKYHPITGNLISVAFYVSESEQYVYNKKGKLKAHWIDETAYNEKGKVIAKRKFTDNIPVD